MSNYLSTEAIPAALSSSTPNYRDGQVSETDQLRVNDSITLTLDATPDAPARAGSVDVTHTNQVPGNELPRLNVQTPSGTLYPLGSLFPAAEAAPAAPQRLLTVTFSNEGKLSHGKLQDLQIWTRLNSDILILSEGAWRYRSIPAEPGILVSCPVLQNWGGVALLGREQVLQGRKLRRHESPKNWSVTCCYLEEDSIVIGAYITPTAASDINALADFLDCIAGESNQFPKALIAGDWNSRTGSWSRTLIDEWYREQGLTLQNPGMETHFQNPGGPGTDLDLLFTKNLSCCLKAVQTPHRGHRRISYEVFFPHFTIKQLPYRINWSQLTANADEFNQKLAELVLGGASVTCAMRTAGEAILGECVRPARRIPRRHRDLIRDERRKLKRFERGTDEYTSSLRRISGILLEISHRGWRRKLTKLCERGMDKEAWKLARSLSRPPKQANIGPHDSVFTSHLDSIFNSNSTSLEEWNIEKTQDHYNVDIDTWFTSDDLQMAIQPLPSRKCPGIDEVPYEGFKVAAFNPVIAASLLTKFNHYLAEGFPHVPIPCKLIGLPKANGETRPLSLLPSEHKILERMIMNRIQPLDSRLHQAQSGFRTGMSCLRSLLQIQLAIMGAIRQKSPLFITSYDVFKAFDQVPKALLAKRLHDHIAPLSLPLARLASEIIACPIEAHIGSKRLILTTGAPQGSILAPRAYVVTDNDLCDLLPDILVKYCDDNTTITTTQLARDEAERTIVEYYNSRGSQLNHDKKKLLEINANTDHDKPIQILGTTVTKRGIKLETNLKMFIDTSRWIRPLSAAHGLSAFQCLSLGRAKVWAKLAHSLPVSLPPLADVTLAWIAFCRVALNCYQTAHRLSVIEAIGCLNTPYWWGTKATIAFYRKATRDRLLSNMIDRDNEGNHANCLSRRINEYLAPAGITWSEIIGTTPLRCLYRNARTNLTNWLRQEMATENDRLGGKLKLSFRTESASYLKYRNGKYAFVFLQETMNPPQAQVGNCLFCHGAQLDHGEHLIRDCPATPPRPNIPQEALFLPDNLPPKVMGLALTWMKQTWIKRRKLRSEAGNPPGEPMPRPPASRFLDHPRARRKKRPLSQVTTSPSDQDNDESDRPPTKRTKRVTDNQRRRPREEHSPTELPPPKKRKRSAATDAEFMDWSPTTVADITATTIAGTHQPSSGQRKSLRTRNPPGYLADYITHSKTRKSHDPPPIPTPASSEDVIMAPASAGELDVDSLHHSIPSQSMQTTRSSLPEPVDQNGVIPRASTRTRKPPVYLADYVTVPCFPLPQRPNSIPTTPLPTIAAPPPDSNSESGRADAPSNPPCAALKIEVPQPRTFNSGLWTADEDSLLIQAISSGLDLREASLLVGSRDIRQISSRLKTKRFQAKLQHAQHQLPSLAKPLKGASRKWHDSELELLERAINNVGNRHDFASIQQHLPGRSIASITCKIRSLQEGGRLVALQNGGYELN